MKFSNTYLGCCIFLHVACLFPKLEREKDNNNVKIPDVKVKKHAEVSIINPDLGVEKAKFVKGTAILKAKRIIVKCIVAIALNTVKIHHVLIYDKIH